MKKNQSILSRISLPEGPSIAISARKRSLTHSPTVSNAIISPCQLYYIDPNHIVECSAYNLIDHGFKAGTAYFKKIESLHLIDTVAIHLPAGTSLCYQNKPIVLGDVPKVNSPIDPLKMVLPAGTRVCYSNGSLAELSGPMEVLMDPKTEVEIIEYTPYLEYIANQPVHTTLVGNSKMTLNYSDTDFSKWCWICVDDEGNEI